MRGEFLLERGVGEEWVGLAGFDVVAGSEARFAGVEREAGVEQPGARGGVGLFHHIFDDDEGGAVFALLEKRGGEAEARGGVGGIEREGAFEEGGGFGERAGFQNGVGDVDKQRGVVGGMPERGAELGRDGGGVERVGHRGRRNGRDVGGPSKLGTGGVNR